MAPDPHHRHQLAVTGQVTVLLTTDLASVDATGGEVLGPPLVRDPDVRRIYEASRGAYLGSCDRGHAALPPAGASR